MKATAIALLMLSVALSGIAWAAEDEDPGRGVARISLINGDVSVRRGDSSDLVAAAVNAPLVVQDQLITGNGSRAELQFDWANMVRLSAGTEIHLADLDNRRYLIELAQGTVTFRVQRESDADVEISTPSVSVRPLRQGSYRVTVREDGDSEITVRSGEADIYTPRGTERLRAGRTLLARGSASDPEYRMASAAPEDTWDRWNEDRDRYYERSEGAYRYVDSSIYGADDLVGYGTWEDVPPYGWCWRPRVSVGWAPYSYGRWSWVDYYGWNWVSYDPWGWAPFHYGRWFNQGPYGWFWYPGPMHTRQTWRPALVAFFGMGGGGVGVGFGRVGWVPLAPNEPFHPWYGRGYYGGYRNTAIVNNVTIVNNTNMVNVYRNARIANAVSAVDGREFGRGAGSVARVSQNDLGRVSLVRGQLPVAPGRESLRVSDRPAVAMPRARASERFFNRTQPARVDRVPFEQQQRSMEQVSRRTFGEPAAGRGIEPRVAPQPAAPDRNPTQDWRRFGGAAARPEAQGGAAPSVRNAPAAQPPSDNRGWRRVEGAPATPRSADPSPRSASPEIRISPPLVRQREAPRVETPREAPQAREAPRVETPRQAPQMVRESPRTESPRPASQVRETPRNSNGGGRESRAPRRETR